MANKRIRRSLVRDTERGDIVNWQGWWGVMEGDCCFHRWDDEPIRLRPDDVVQILIPLPPKKRKKP